MSNKRHKAEEIVTKLRQVEVLVGQGMARIDAIREIGVVEQTYYRWRKLYGGMGRDQVKELKRLQNKAPEPSGRCRRINPEHQPPTALKSASENRRQPGQSRSPRSNPLVAMNNCG